MVSKGEWERVVLFCSLVTSSPMEAVNWRFREDPLGRLQPQLDALSYDTGSQNWEITVIYRRRISSGKQISNLMAKWSMTSSSRSSPFLCGTIERGGERAAWAWSTQTVGFGKESVSYTSWRWQTQQDDKPKPSKRTRKQNYSSHGISMSLIKLCTVLTTTISLALYSLWLGDGPGV